MRTANPSTKMVWLYNPDDQPYDIIDEITVNEVKQLSDIETIYYLALREDGELQLCDKQLSHHPLHIDFSHAYYRFRGGTEWLPKTLKGMAGANVADATAGWGRDSWLLAYRGFSVTMFERNPYLVILLMQALKRARRDVELAVVANRLALKPGDANTSLTRDGAPSFDAIYLDPMYPNRRKKAKVKKDMQALHQLLGGEEADAHELLSTALSTARNRVVVKRPKGASTVSAQIPNFAIEAPNTRFDVYLCH